MLCVRGMSVEKFIESTRHFLDYRYL